MKKIYIFAAFVVALAVSACKKEITVETAEVSEPYVITATYEQPTEASGTKVSISEGVSNFSLIWDGTETMKVATSSSTNTSDFSTSSYGTNTATFTGTGLPSFDGSTTNYIGIVSSFGSSATDYARGAIKVEQIYSGSSVAQYSFLVARADNCAKGSLSALDFKTMNAFLKLSLVKGTPADGSLNTYDKMYVTNVIVEAVNEEQIAGRFAVSKTASGWQNAYAADANISDGDKSKTVTLDCTNGGSVKGEEIIASPKDFYIAIAFGTFAKGLKVTINVKNDDGDTGQMVGYISKNSSFNVVRNTMIRMPELTVRPADTTAEVICWSENWNGATTSGSASDSATPSACGTTGTYVYGGGPVTYSQSANSVYVRDETYAGGTAPELMLTKGQTWTISGIPTAGATTLSLVYKSNNTNNSVALSGADKATITGSSKDYTITTGGDATITLVFSASKNARIDDVVLKVAD